MLIEIAKSIFIVSQRGDALLPQKSKRNPVRYAEADEIIRGIIIDVIGAILKCIFLLRRIKDKRKL